MTWHDPGGNPVPGGSGGPDDDATRADWNLSELDAMVGNGGGGATPNAGQPADPGAAAPPPPVTGTPPLAGDAPAGPPPGPPPAWTDPGAAAAPPVSPGYGGAGSGPGYAPGGAAGYGYGPGAAPGGAYPPAGGPGMAWAPPPVERRTGMAYGGTLERFVAYMVDGVIMTLIGFALWIPAALAGFGPFANIETTFTRSYTTTRETFELTTVGLDAASVAVLVLLGVVSAVISAAYFVFQWSGSSRATLGMRILHLQIGNAADGRTITRGQAFKRWIALGGWTGILSAIPFISTPVTGALFLWELVLLITVVTSSTKQGLHDRWAGTAIVAPSGDSGNGLIVGCVLIIAAIVVLFIGSFVALLFLGSQVSEILSTIGESV